MKVSVFADVWGAQAANPQSSAACRRHGNFILCFRVKKSVSGRLPDTAGWQPALPNPKE
jgi:hypothetical protein